MTDPLKPAGLSPTAFQFRLLAMLEDIEHRLNDRFSSMPHERARVLLNLRVAINDLVDEGVR